MRTLFLRIYLALCGVCLAAFLAAGAWDQARRRPPTASVVRALTEAPDAVREAFDAHPLPEAQRVIREEFQLTAIRRRLEGPLPPDIAAQLAIGEDVLPRAGRPLDAWVVLSDGAHVVHLRSVGAGPPPLPWIVGALLIGLGVTIALMLLPLDRDLQQLARAAQRFGAGEHDVRAEVRPNGATAHLADRFNQMATELRQLVEGQRDLLLAVSHELRTPLNRLRFATELLAEEPDEALRRARSEEMQTDLDELDQLVGDLLAWGRLGQAVPEGESVLVAPLVASVLEGARRGQPTVVTEASVPPDIEVHADLGDLRRALSNLVHNAARHAATQVRVEAALVDDMVEIRVDDDGPGIPPDERRRVLEPFVRLDAARTRDRGGVGLGLALASRVAEAHGGQLTIGDAPIGGARLVFALPLTVPDAT